MNKQILAVSLLALAGTTAALAAPREALDFVAANGGSPLIGTGALGAGNSIVSANAVGGYNVGACTLAGNISAWATGTYGSETRVQITMPNGGVVVFGPFSPLTSTPPGPVSFSVGANITPFAAAGSWTAEPYETFNDPGDDATYDALTLTLDDGVLPPPPPPSPSTDLGDRSVTSSAFTQLVTTLGGADIQWFRIQLPAVTAADGWADIWTMPTGDASTDMTDTEIGLYDNFGNGASTIWNDDDGGAGLMSQLTFGSTTSRGPIVDPVLGTGNDRNGSGGPLAGGVYYLAVGRFNVNWTAGFGAGGTSASAQTTTTLNFNIAPPGAPTVPTGAGSEVSVGGSALLRVTVTGGINPDSTGIVVRGNLTSLGGSANQIFFDDGSNGDESAGDGIYSYIQPIPSVGSYTIPFTVSDAQTRSSTGNIGFASSNPTGVGTANPANPLAGDSVLLTVTANPGANPASTSLTVTGDTSSLGGSASQTFFDDGSNGDATAGDSIYSFTITVPTGTAEGATPVPFTIGDAQGRAATGTINLGIDAAGDTLATAGVPSGSGPLDSITGFFSVNDVDMFKITVCDFANFSATTSGGSTADTQLFLFDSSGMGVTSNDDNGTPQSTLTSQFLAADGTYYIAISGYNRDPIDSGAQLIWNNTPFATERAPDGPGAGSPLDSWTGTSFYDNQTYTITFTGTCYPSAGPVCGPADLGGTGGVAGADGHLDNNDFIVYIDNFFNNLASADIGTTGGVAGSDGLWDNNDFIVYIDQFFAAPASCR